MEITVLTFGVVAEIVGESHLVLTDVASTADVQEKLEAKFPRLKTIRYTLAVDKQMVTTSTKLGHNATVALLPPFSGG